MAEFQIIGKIIGAFALAGFLAYFLTPFVKQLAARLGAIDTPKDDRRMHKKPIPRLGGLAIFLSFLCTLLLFGEYSAQMLSVMLGATIIVVLGIFDDIMALGAKFKFIVQVLAACIPVCMGGLRIEVFTSFNPFSDSLYFDLGILAIPVTILWIVGITNAVNLIDGLDGLAVGVSSIAAITMLAVSLLAGQPMIALIMAALAGACIGFMPYNFNPASIFMGDTGSTFFDTFSAITRRIASGRSPMSPDRGHVHHKLIDMGFNQKQAVAILYAISGTLGLAAVVLTSSGEMKAMILLIAVLLVLAAAICILYSHEQHLHEAAGKEEEHGES